MNSNEILVELESLGSEQIRKTYVRHGVTEPMFGVKYGDLGKIVKRIKKNHPLALDLWATGNHDARALAMKIADPRQVTAADVERWVGEMTSYVLTDAVSELVSGSAIPPEQLAAWSRSEDEWLGRVGWQLLGRLAMNDNSVSDSFFYPLLETISAEIHTRKNRVREAMNSALIAFGTRNADLEARAIAVAREIGIVHVDHGDTACKTPDAVEYIRKTNARKQRIPA